MPDTEVLVIAENRTYAQIVGARAPYPTTLTAYGSATNVSANYPVSGPAVAGTS